MEHSALSGPVRELAGRLMTEGARAVVLAGSIVRGEAGPESDIDLYAFGARSGYFLERQHGHLVSITWREPEEERAAFLDPSKAGAVIPAWRGAVILEDPEGLAAALQREAREWSWADIGDEALDRYVAREVTELAEEIHKLVAALRAGRSWTAAVQRNVLALHLAPILSVHLRFLYETENRLWDLVAAEMGPEWQKAQRDAFEASLEPSCHAALRLYALAAAAVSTLLEPGQRDVVTYASSLAP
jgi:hypothetical protein